MHTQGPGVWNEIKAISRMLVVFITYLTVKDWDDHLLCVCSPIHSPSLTENVHGQAQSHADAASLREAGARRSHSKKKNLVFVFFTGTQHSRHDWDSYLPPPIPMSMALPTDPSSWVCWALCSSLSPSVMEDSSFPSAILAAVSLGRTWACSTEPCCRRHKPSCLNVLYICKI